MAQFFYDRVVIYVNGTEYLPDGQIRNYKQDGMYNSKQQQGFTPDGNPAGQVIGNSVVNITWDELLPIASEYVNWRQFLIANPNTTINVTPISLATGVPEAPNFDVVGINAQSININAASEGESIIRTCTFNANSSTNM